MKCTKSVVAKSSKITHGVAVENWAAKSARTPYRMISKNDLVFGQKRKETWRAANKESAQNMT